MLQYFTDRRLEETATFEQKVTTANAQGQPVETWETVTGGEDIEVNFWTEQSRETSVNDRFVDQATGTVLIDPADITFTPDTTMRMDIGGVKYYVTGFDDTAGFGEQYVLSWRREI